MKFISKGAFHLHSTYSDGTGTIKEIADDAKKSGLDWIIITDHNTLSGLHNDEEGWYNGLAVIIGEEISPGSGNHYLSIGTKEEVSCKLSPQEFINKIKSLGGIGFIAHPDESVSRKNNYPPLRWTDWNIKGFDGIEIWNYMSDWVDNYDSRLQLYHLLARHKILKGPTDNVLKWWDSLNNENTKIIPAVGSLDSHALKFGPVKVFPYHDTFKTITNHIFLKKNLSLNFDKAKIQILEALKSGNNIIVNRILNKKNNINKNNKINNNKLCFSIINKKQKTFPGEKTNLESDSKLLIKLPQKLELK